MSANTPANSGETATTTTTTVAETTTTTTQPAVETTTTTTVEKQGEVSVDKEAKADVLGGANSGPEDDAKAQKANIEGAKADALANHDADHADDHKDGRSYPSAV